MFLRFKQRNGEVIYINPEEITHFDEHSGKGPNGETLTNIHMQNWHLILMGSPDEIAKTIKDQGANNG